MAFPIDAIGYTTNYNFAKPYIDQKPWYDTYYSALDLIDVEIKNREDENIALDVRVTTIEDATAFLIDTIDEKTLDAGVTIEGLLFKDGRITNVLEPLSGSEPATKYYVDNIIVGDVPAGDWLDSVLTRTGTPPGVPSEGDAYLITIGTGVWSGKDEQRAEWTGAQWAYETPTLGTMVAVEDEETHYKYVTSGWIKLATTITHNLLDGLNDGDYKHLTDVQFSGLTGALDTSLHKHDNMYYTEAELDSKFEAVTLDSAYDNQAGTDRVITVDDGHIKFNMRQSLGKYVEFRDDYSGNRFARFNPNSAIGSMGLEFGQSDTVHMCISNNEIRAGITGATYGQLLLRDFYISSAISLGETGVSGLSGFTKTSLVGGLNELKVDVLLNNAYRAIDHIPLSQKGSVNGVAELDAGGKVPTVQLPSYVDDVLEYADFASFPVTGETGKIYVALDTNKTYRWSGSVYVEISASLALGETSSTAYRGDRGKIAYDHSQLIVGNPHISTFDQIYDAEPGVNRIITVDDESIIFNTKQTQGKYIEFRDTDSSTGFARFNPNSYSGTMGLEIGRAGSPDITISRNIISAGVGGYGALLFNDLYLSTAIPLSETGVTGLVGFTKTSLVGSLNELKESYIIKAFTDWNNPQFLGVQSNDWGTWVNANATLTYEPNNSRAVYTATGSPNNEISLYRMEFDIDCIWSVKMQVSSGNIYAFLRSRYYSGSGYQFIVDFDGAGSSIKLERGDNGIATLLDSGTYTINTATYYDFKIKIINDDIKCYIDGVEVLSATDATYTEGLSEILIAGAGTGDTAYLDFVKIEEKVSPGSV